MTQEHPQRKPELTEKSRQVLEDLKETLVGFMNSPDLSDEMKTKTQDLIDAVDSEMFEIPEPEN